MSWSFTATVPANTDPAKAIKTAADAYTAQLASNDLQLDAEATDQIEDVTAAAADLLKTGVLGDAAEHAYTVNVGGHASPGHTTGDSLYLNIQQAAAPATPTSTSAPAAKPTT